MPSRSSLEFVLSLADRVYVLAKGAVRYTGTPAVLRANEGTVKQYLTV